MYYAKVIADSIGPHGVRLTTMEVCYPLIIHAEMLRHRIFSRNVMSNRAVPVDKMIQSVRIDPFIPERFPKNKSGMQSTEWLEGNDDKAARSEWMIAISNALASVERMTRLKIHKQIVNRVLGPYLWCVEVITSTQWSNFFSLRCHPAAQPEMQKIAYMMQYAYYTSKPQEAYPGYAHLPYIPNDERDLYPNKNADLLKYASVGRCNGVSYLRQGEDTWSIETSADKGMMHRDNRHWSGFEHVGICNSYANTHALCANFLRGWTQWRKTFPGENMTQFVPNHKLLTPKGEIR